MSKQVIQALNNERNKLIKALKTFRESRVNRKYLSPSHFSITINSIRKEIKVIDDLIMGHKSALTKTKESGTLHVYKEELRQIEPVGKIMYAVFDKSESEDEKLKYDLSNLISIFPDHGSAFDEQEVAKEWGMCKVEVIVKVNLKDKN